MAKEKGDALCCHAAFYPAAPKGFAEVQQVLQHHFFCEVFGCHITVVNKKKTKFREIIADGMFAVMTY
jgi:Na+/H+-dicarboxylate symporter